MSLTFRDLSSQGPFTLSHLVQSGIVSIETGIDTALEFVHARDEDFFLEVREKLSIFKALGLFYKSLKITPSTSKDDFRHHIDFPRVYIEVGRQYKETLRALLGYGITENIRLKIPSEEILLNDDQALMFGKELEKIVFYNHGLDDAIVVTDSNPSFEQAICECAYFLMSYSDRLGEPKNAMPGNEIITVVLPFLRELEQQGEVSDSEYDRLRSIMGSSFSEAGDQKRFYGFLSQYPTQLVQASSQYARFAHKHDRVIIGFLNSTLLLS
jgi:hypothetical protein